MLQASSDNQKQKLTGHHDDQDTEALVHIGGGSGKSGM